MSETPPFLGPATPRRCTRWMGPGMVCDLPPVLHVAWTEDADGIEGGFVCQEHVAELGIKWKFLAQHPVGACCGMPGAMWIEQEQLCRYVDGLPTGEPGRVVAEPVAA